MKWVREHWQWVLLNLCGLAIMASLLWRVTAVNHLDPDHDLVFLDSGKWAIRFLLLSLSMTPLNTLFAWRSAIKLRKPAGLWAFEFALLHFLLNVTITWDYWLQSPIPDILAALGVLGLTVLTFLAATSFQWAMKRMGKWWKRLHRLVYAAGLAIAAHALLEAANKRIVVYDPQADLEAWLYLAILLALLAARIPAIRSSLAGLRYRRRVSKETVS